MRPNHNDLFHVYCGDCVALVTYRIVIMYRERHTVCALQCSLSFISDIKSDIETHVLSLDIIHSHTHGSALLLISFYYSNVLASHPAEPNTYSILDNFQCSILLANSPSYYSVLQSYNSMQFLLPTATSPLYVVLAPHCHVASVCSSCSPLPRRLCM